MRILKALEIDKQLGAEPEIAVRLNNIAQLYDKLGEHDKALEHCEKALEIAKKIGAEDSIALYLENIGAIYNSVGEYDKAIDSLKKSIQLKEKIRKTAKSRIRRDYLDSQIHTYQFLSSVFFKKGDPQGVFDTIEQGRARFLAEQVAGVDSDIKKPTLAEIQKGLTGDEAILIFSNMNRDDFILMAISAEEIVMKELSKENFLATCIKEYKKPVLMLLEKQRGVILPRQCQRRKILILKRKKLTLELLYITIVPFSPIRTTKEIRKFLGSYSIRCSWDPFLKRFPEKQS